MGFAQPARIPDGAHVSDEDYDRFYRPRSKRSSVTDPRDPAYDDRGAAELEERIESRAAELVDRGYCEDHAWTVAQDELCPQEEW